VESPCIELFALVNCVPRIVLPQVFETALLEHACVLVKFEMERRGLSIPVERRSQQRRLR
jgi:hypothetical protein